MIIFEPGETAPRMLIADDDPSIVRLLADQCSLMGFEVETAFNGTQALPVDDDLEVEAGR